FTRASSAGNRSRVVLITSWRSASRSIAPFHRYTEITGPCTLTQAARRSSTSVRAMVSAVASLGAVVKTRITLVDMFPISPFLHFPIPDWTSALCIFSLYFGAHLLYCDAGVSENGVPPKSKARPPVTTQPGRTRRIVHVLLLFVAVVIIVDTLVGDRGLLATLRARKEYDELSSAIARQRAENARLWEEARRLKDDPSAIEEVARRELGLIRPGGKVFIIKDV